MVVSKLAAAVTEDDAEWESPIGDVEDWTMPAATAEPEFTRRPRLHLGDPVAAPEAEAESMMAEPDFIDQPDPDLSEVEMPDEVQVAQEPVSPKAFVRTVTPPAEDTGWADAAEAAVLDDLAQSVEDDVADAGLFDEGGMVFDEEVLRDLVRDIIREELAGTLGERITRNVRKLVRAEIARALAVREFE